MYFHRLLVVLALISESRVGWLQSRDIVRYIDPISTADPETSGHKASQPCSRLEVVFQESLQRSETLPLIGRQF